MTRHSSQDTFGRTVRIFSLPGTWCAVLAIYLAATSAAMAQDVRYSYLDIAFMGQDVGKSGFKPTPVIGQTVDLDAKDGDGIRFRGSVGTWHNLYAFLDYGSTDIDVAVVVTNQQGQFPAMDEFDYTAIRGGVGLRYPLNYRTDIYGEVSYESLDMDFGSFAGEDFDTDAQHPAAAFGIRRLINDDFEVRAHARYSEHADVNLSTGEFDAGGLFGVGFGWQLLRGLSIIGEYESGEFSNWSLGFRLDLDED